MQYTGASAHGLMVQRMGQNSPRLQMSVGGLQAEYREGRLGSWKIQGVTVTPKTGVGGVW